MIKNICYIFALIKTPIFIIHLCKTHLFSLLENYGQVARQCNSSGNSAVYHWLAWGGVPEL